VVVAVLLAGVLAVLSAEACMSKCMCVSARGAQLWLFWLSVIALQMNRCAAKTLVHHRTVCCVIAVVSCRGDCNHR
jgi:hypothetical protein